MTELSRAPDVLPCAHFMGGRVMLGGPVYTIQGETGSEFRFEWHPYFGPSRVGVRGDIINNGFFGVRSAFWPLFERWMDGGKMVDEEGRCVLAPPRVDIKCDATCPDCAGRGWFKVKGDRRRWVCHGIRNRVLKSISKPAVSP